MIRLIDIPSFISEKITHRSESLCKQDIDKNSSELSQNIKGKKVLVIGGAGTIGSNFIKQALNFSPQCLHVVDLNENGLTELTRDLRSDDNYVIPNNYKTYPFDFSSQEFKRLFEDEKGYDIVANFAALKHVRSEKDQYAVSAIIENNVIKAKGLLDLLTTCPPSHFFCVSTDKAANPVNVMGATKKLMEELIMSYSDKFKITTARFANVAFSNGSLLDGYIHRILKRQPFSCPSDVERYFVSPEESGQICLLACILGKTGEIFFPKLKANELTNFKDITIDFIHELGFTVYYCSSEKEAKEVSINDDTKSYPVYFFDTDTSGEKLYEEFYTDTDVIELETYKSLGVIKNAKKIAIDKLENILETLEEEIQNKSTNKASIVSLLKRYLPEFDHIETGKSLDQKM